jgi:hypothetical protein
MSFLDGGNEVFSAAVAEVNERAADCDRFDRCFGVGPATLNMGHAIEFYALRDFYV